MPTPAPSALGTHNLVPRLAAVHQVCEEDGVLGAGQPARCHFARTLLDSDALVVLVDGLQRTDTDSGAVLPGGGGRGLSSGSSPDWTAAPGRECSLLSSLVTRRHRPREGREPGALAPHPTSAPGASLPRRIACSGPCSSSRVCGCGSWAALWPELSDAGGRGSLCHPVGWGVNTAGEATQGKSGHGKSIKPAPRKRVTPEVGLLSNHGAAQCVQSNSLVSLPSRRAT